MNPSIKDECLDWDNLTPEKQKELIKQRDKILVENREKTADIEQYKQLRYDILCLLKDKERSEATELIVQEIEGQQHFYTIRDDDKLEIWTYNEGIYIPNGVTIIKEKCRDILQQHNTTHLMNQVISKIETDTYIDQNKFFNNNIIEEIVCENGILNLITRELTPYNPEKIFFTKIPITYEPEEKCENIIKFMLEILKNPDDIKVIQELFGYLLWKEYNIERAIMLIGTGRNGKGKLIELMKRFIGFDNYSSVPLQNLEGDNFNTANLHKKLANLCGDIDDRALKFTGSFKNLTGRDNITANRKFKTSVNFENYAKMIFAANNLPRTHDISDAFFMRWVLLEFPYTFLKENEYEEQKHNPWVKLRDPNIIKNIVTPSEMSGLLNWSLEGLYRLQEQKDFTYSNSSSQVKNMWLRKSDSFMAFCMDILEEQYGTEMHKSEIRHLYNEYCKKHKLNPVSDKSIKYTLTSNFGAYEKQTNYDGSRIHVWVGVGLKSIDYEEEKQQSL